MDKLIDVLFVLFLMFCVVCVAGLVAADVGLWPHGDHAWRVDVDDATFWCDRYAYDDDGDLLLYDGEGSWFYGAFAELRIERPTNVIVRAEVE